MSSGVDNVNAHDEARDDGARDDGLKRETFTVTGMDCSECALKIDRVVSRLPGVRRVDTAFGSSRMAVSYDPEAVTDDAITAQVRRLGYGIHTTRAQAQAHHDNTLPSRVLSMAVAGAFLLVGVILSRSGLEAFSRAFYVVSIAVGGWPVFRSAYGSLRAGVIGDINVLMVTAVLGAAVLNAWDEGATVLFLFAFGEWLESYTMDRTRGSIRALMSLAPPVARLVKDEREVEVRSEEVPVGATIRIRPGERIPLDGEVVGGNSAVNQAPITGESMPVEKRAGDAVYAGTVNGNGALDIRTSRTDADSTIARIIELVQEAQGRKAPSERFVDRFSRYWTPGAMAMAVFVAVVFPLVRQEPFHVWFYRSLVLLVAACPCALVISTPVAIVSALGAAARRGTLIKGGAALEAAGTVDIVAFDKTGTLTEGLPSVTEVLPAEGVDAQALAALAAAVEANSQHPLADAVRRYADEHRLEPPAVEQFSSVPGQGVSAVVHGATFWVGSLASVVKAQALPSDLKAGARRMEATGQTVLVVTTDAGPLGLIAVTDQPRPDAAKHVARLKEAGVHRVVMLTGDAPAAAQAVARAVGIEEVHAGLLPADKRDVVERLERDGRVAMVGDGVNDSPALAAATVGVAMGAVGSDAAIEAADIALMSDDLAQTTEILHLSRRTMRIIHQNVTIALALKLLFLAAVFTGYATLWMAVVADTGASVLVTLNAMRLIRM